MTAAELTLKDVIENVRRNEDRYKNLEVVMASDYGISDRTANKTTFGNEVIRQNRHTRYVSQGDWFRLEIKGSSQDSESTRSLDRIRSFDGEMTRVLEQNAVGNLSRERLADENVIRPHMLLVRQMRMGVPFSTYLSGHEAIRADPNGANLQNGLTMKVTYQGEDERSGLKCHKVLVVVLAGDQPHDGRLFWLAEDRNFLPIEEHAYTYRFSKDIPLGQSVATDLREIRPGVWFPIRVETTAYEPFTIQREGRQVLVWRERFVVEKVDLDPEYDREFFSHVDFPDGIAMYEVRRGEILRSWRQGEPPESK